jgi:hypothetical protein
MGSWHNLRQAQAAPKGPVHEANLIPGGDLWQVTEGETASAKSTLFLPPSWKTAAISESMCANTSPTS